MGERKEGLRDQRSVRGFIIRKDRRLRVETSCGGSGGGGSFIEGGGEEALATTGGSSGFIPIEIREDEGTVQVEAADSCGNRSTDS